MKKITILIVLVAFLNACKSKQATVETPMEDLYEILFESEYLGSEIKFYEMVTESNEFKMLINMKPLKGKIKESDIETSNFIILNSGMKSTGGYAIGVERVEEFPDKILVKVKEESPKMGENVTMAISYPMCIVKINSKKKIVIQ
jgi:hypothetical protein